MVVQDLATQWIQSYPCKTKTSQETQKSLMKFLEPTRKPKVIYTDNSLEFGKSCEELSWNHCTSTRHTDEKQMGSPKEQCVELRKGHLRYCCNQVWTMNGERIPWSVTAIFETFKITCLLGRHQCPLTDQVFLLEQWSALRRTYRDYINVALKSCQVYSSVMHDTR